MEIFNLRSLTQRQRFNTALLMGFLATVVLGIATGFIRQYLNFTILIWGVGYGVAWTIKKFGRGVQVKFSILGAIYAVIGILMSDVVWMFGLSRIIDPSAYMTVLTFFLNDNITSIIWLLYRLVAIYIAYSYSRVF